MGRRFSEAERTTIWDMREAGVPVKRIAAPPKLPRHSASLTRSFPRLSRPSASRRTGTDRMHIRQPTGPSSRRAHRG